MRVPLALALLSSFVLTASCGQIENQNDSTVAACVSAGPSDPKDLTAAAREDLDKLVSSDADVRRKALAELALEFSSGATQAEGRFRNYGSALLPVLHRVILDLNDPYADDAIEAIFWMGTVNQLRSEAGRTSVDNVGRREVSQELDKFCHYPVPSDYAPLKDALISALSRSTDREARYWAALSLADGFEPVSEIEEVLATRLPLERDNPKVQSAVLGSVSEIADRHAVSRATELRIIQSLASPNVEVRRIALRIVKRHQYDGAVDGLLGSISSVSNAYELSEIIGALPQFGPFDEAQIAEFAVTLEDWAAGIENEQIRDEMEQGVRSTIQKMKYSLTDTKHQFGFVQVGESSILLHTANRGLMPGTPVGIVNSDTVLIVAAQADNEQEASGHVQVGSFPVTTYYLGITTNTLRPELVDNRIAYILTDSPDFAASGLVHSSCQSNEGIHHSVWSTGDAGWNRVWSAYQYLGYSVEPNCAEEDLAE